MHANKRTGYDKTVRNPRPRTLKRKNPDVFGIMPKVEPCPEPDLQDLSVYLGERFAAEASYAGGAHRPIAQPGENEAV